jgi:NDP-sugar pyrophosphorylase family protein
LKTLILANGYGERLRPITDFINKTMIPVDGKPVLEHIICRLQWNHFTDIVIAVGVYKEQIMNYFKNGKQWGVNITYVSNSKSNDSPNGTAGELLIARHLLEEESDFLIYYGDILCNTDLRRFYDFHCKQKSIITLNGIEGFKIETGVIEFDENKIVTAFKEKPFLPIVTNNAIMFCTHEIWKSENIQIGNDISNHVLPEFVSNGQVSVYIPPDVLGGRRNYCYDVGTINRLEIINELFKNGRVGETPTVK